MFNKLTHIIPCCLILSGCFFKNKENLSIDFSRDSATIEVKGIDEASFYQAKEFLKAGQNESLLSVAMISANDIESDYPGSILIDKDILRFVPNTPFVKGNSYLVQTTLESSFAKKTDIIKMDLGRRVKYKTQLLVR